MVREVEALRGGGGRGGGGVRLKPGAQPQLGLRLEVAGGLVEVAGLGGQRRVEAAHVLGGHVQVHVEEGQQGVQPGARQPGLGGVGLLWGDDGGGLGVGLAGPHAVLTQRLLEPQDVVQEVVKVHVYAAVHVDVHVEVVRVGEDVNDVGDRVFVALRLLPGRGPVHGLHQHVDVHLGQVELLGTAQVKLLPNVFTGHRHCYY